MTRGQIAPDEVIYRRIPPWYSHFQPPDRITSPNFKLRDGELGLSVYRARVVDAAEVLSKPEAIAGSRVAQATVSEIRAARNSKGEALNLEVLPVDDEDDPGHAEIRSPVQGVITTGAAKALRALFKLVESSPQ